MINDYTHKDIAEMISFLKEKTNGFSFQDFNDDSLDVNTVYAIEKSASRMSDHLCMLGYKPIVSYDDLDEYTAGNINLDNSMSIKINIRPEEMTTREQVLSIIAHELCHKFMFLHNIEVKGIKNEFLTDCCAVFTGFGDLMVKGCETKSRAVGYFTKEQFMYAKSLIDLNNIPYAEEIPIDNKDNIFTRIFSRLKRHYNQ